MLEYILIIGAVILGLALEFLLAWFVGNLLHYCMTDERTDSHGHKDRPGGH